MLKTSKFNCDNKILQVVNLHKFMEGTDEIQYKDSDFNGSLQASC